MGRFLGFIAVMLAVAGCASPPTSVTVTATPPASPAPILVVTETPAATATDTPEPTPTATATPKPAAKGAAPTEKVTYKFQAPVPLGPSRPTIYKDGNDITFTYGSVGPLEADYCYLLHIEMINPNVNPGNRGDDFLDKDSCGDQSVAGKPLTFVLYRGNFKNVPNYGTILPEAVRLAPLQPKQVLKVTWFVQVVQNNGLSADNVHYRVTPLSPPGAVMDFDFEPPS